MAEGRHHNVLFDSPLPIDQPIAVGGDVLVENIESIYSAKTFKALFQIYMGLLLCQYVSVYATVPFDDIEGRPPLCVITGLYVLIMFSVNACLLPTCSSTIPSLFSFRSLLFSTLLEFIGVAFHVSCVPLVLNVDKMYSYEYDSQTKMTEKTDVTTYIQIITITCLVLNCLTFMVLVFSSYMAAQSLRNLINRTDRRDKNVWRRKS
ncbi:uncharacterized protein RJT21DRAFT_27003 [Scheffersomyces amazonensis]|uniref:uncharacterized protein n=1 Tax=Scheffersomyces amazonensis TaxID=1078765 RepID=UPI00315DF564